MHCTTINWGQKKKPKSLISIPIDVLYLRVNCDINGVRDTIRNRLGSDRKKRKCSIYCDYHVFMEVSKNLITTDG